VHTLQYPESAPVDVNINYYDAAAKVVRSVKKDWAGELGPDNSVNNARVIRETTTLDNGLVSKVETDYETFPYAVGSCYGCTGTPWVGGGFTATRLNPTERREFDYGSGAPGPLLRRKDYAYLHNNNSAYATLNIVDRPATITVYDGSGNKVSQTTYEYDNYSHSGMPAMQSSNAVQHDANRGTSYLTRGNPTQISKWRNTDAAMLSTINQYDDAGNLIATKDPNGNLNQ
jgi:hypothetical protein